MQFKKPFQVNMWTYFFSTASGTLFFIQADDFKEPVPRHSFGGWFQVVFNLIRSNDGQGFRVHHNGELVQNITTKSVFRNTCWHIYKY